MADLADSRHLLEFLEEKPALDDLGKEIDKWRYRCRRCEKYEVRIHNGVEPMKVICDSLVMHRAETHPKMLEYLKMRPRARALLAELDGRPED